MGTPTTEYLSPKVLARPEHQLSRGNLSAEALKVLYRLHRSGYAAYLVGGSVRDLLLGNRPKDFDVATNARPQEIRRLFRNSRIIGRRFRLVHVFFRAGIVEVATFRASPEPPESPNDWEEGAAEEAEENTTTDRPQPATDDVVFGTPAEDARRRDFTVNALFYNIADFSIIDHVGGIEDLERGVIRTIGDPDQRFIEDPVRMMRALEYSVRLGFEIDPRTVRRSCPARSDRGCVVAASDLRTSGVPAFGAGRRYSRSVAPIGRVHAGVSGSSDRYRREHAGPQHGGREINAGRDISDPSLIGAIFWAASSRSPKRRPLKRSGRQPPGPGTARRFARAGIDEHASLESDLAPAAPGSVRADQDAAPAGPRAPGSQAGAPGVLPGGMGTVRICGGPGLHFSRGIPGVETRLRKVGTKDRSDAFREECDRASAHASSPAAEAMTWGRRI